MVLPVAVPCNIYFNVFASFPDPPAVERWRITRRLAGCQELNAHQERGQEKNIT
jgi:hypothetical protein